MSEISRQAIFVILSRHYIKVGISIVNDLSDLEDLVARQPDLVFLGMEFVRAGSHLDSRHEPKIWLSEYLEENGIAYTGSGREAHELERDKPLAKQRVLDAGFKTASFYIARRHGSADATPPLAFPLFVKPTNRGGGVGIDGDSVVYDTTGLKLKTRSIAARWGVDSLIEEYLPGREFSVAILEDEYPGRPAVMSIELITPPDGQGRCILSSHVKSSNVERAIEVGDQILKADINGLALDVFNALGGRDYGRIDIRCDKMGVPHFLEANLIPSLIAGYGSFPKACALNMDLDHESMILRITRLGLSRSDSSRMGVSEKRPLFAPILSTPGPIYDSI